MTVLKELSVLIGVDLTGLRRGLDDADKAVDKYARDAQGRFVSTRSSVDQITDGLDRLSGRTSKLAGDLAGVFLPAGLALGYGVSVAADFETTLTEIEVRADLTAEGIDRIRDSALEMGADTVFSAQQAADAYLQLLTSGSSVEESLAILPDVLDAAAASGEDLGRTADIVTDILASFQLPAVTEDGFNNATLAVDALAQASGASSATMTTLGEGFANVGGQARAYGLDIQETAAILAIFSENGIKGAEAGTQLRSMLTNMSRDTADVRAAWNALGTSMYDQAGNMRPLQAVLEDIRVGLDGKTEQEQTRILQDLAGTYGILGLRASLGAVSIDEMVAKMRESATASEVADARMDTFGGALDSLKGSIETFMITAGTPFIENVLQPAVGTLTDIVNGITDWADENPEAASTLLAIVGAGAVAVPVLWGVSAVARAASTGISLISGAIGILGGPGTLLVLGAAGAFAILNTEVGEGVTVFDVLKVGALGTIDTIDQAVKRLTAAPEDLWKFDTADKLIAEMQRQLDEDGPFTLSPDLEVAFERDPIALAESMSYQARLIFVEAWNQATEHGDMDFLQDAAPLMLALDQLNLVPTELGDLDTSAFLEAARGAFNEELDEMGNQIILPGTEWSINAQTLMIHLERLGEDQATITANIDDARIIAALEEAISDGGAVELDVPVSLALMPDGTYDTVTLDDLLRGATLSPAMLEELSDQASEDLRTALMRTLGAAYQANDTAAIEVLAPLAVSLGIDFIDIQNQFAADVTAAAEAQTITVNPTVVVDPTVVYSNMPSGTTGSGTNYDGTPDLDGYPWTPMRTGGVVPYDNFLASLHAGELVVPADRWATGPMMGAAADSVAGGAHVTLNITVVGKSPREVAIMVRDELNNLGIGGGAFG